jgi:hypothetical protein
LFRFETVEILIIVHFIKKKNRNKGTIHVAGPFSGAAHEESSAGVRYSLPHAGPD